MIGGVGDKGKDDRQGGGGEAAGSRKEERARNGHKRLHNDCTSAAEGGHSSPGEDAPSCRSEKAVYTVVLYIKHEKVKRYTQ